MGIEKEVLEELQRVRLWSRLSRSILSMLTQRIAFDSGLLPLPIVVVGGKAGCNRRDRL